MAAQGADADAVAVNLDLSLGEAQDLVGLGLALPLLTALAALHLLVDPGDKRACKWNGELGNRHGGGVHSIADFLLDLEDGGGGILQILRACAVEHAHLGKELAHVLGAGA